MTAQLLEIYLEVAPKRTFAGAIAWPGWCRSGREEASALAALLAYAPRYAEVVAAAGLDLPPLDDLDQLTIVGRVAGDATTEFGAPGALAPGDEAPVAGAELARLVTILRASWATLDAAAGAVGAAGLASGPRGGGRSVERILAHVTDAEGGYLSRVGWKGPPDPAARREVVVEAMKAVAPLGVPPPGPRGGTRVPARYFARRVAWHVLDHAWEIQDRTLR